MLIIGAKGFAKEVLDSLYSNKYEQEIAFYDDINSDMSEKLYESYQILKNEHEVKDFFLKNGNS